MQDNDPIAIPGNYALLKPRFKWTIFNNASDISKLWWVW